MTRVHKKQIVCVVLVVTLGRIDIHNTLIDSSYFVVLFISENIYVSYHVYDITK